MSKFQRAAPPRKSILGALQATEMIDSKPTLPAEILATVLDFLSVPDQLRFARTSRRMREMVYDDTRWVARLQSMGCWNEAEAKARFDEAVRRRRDAANAPPPAVPGQAPPAQASTTIFDASVEEERRRQQQQQQQHQQVSQARDGFETMTLGGPAQPAAPTSPQQQDPLALLDVLKRARSARGHARQEYGKIYGALAPFYLDLVRVRSHADAALFKVFRDPERQAAMLARLGVFARSDWAGGWRAREERLAAMTGLFEAAVLREFEQGYEFWDVDGRMRRYAHVLDLLGGSAAGVELFIQKHPTFSGREGGGEGMANSMDCINQASYENITLEPSRIFFDGLARKLQEQGETIARIFPKPGGVFWAFVDKVREDMIMEYATPLFDECHRRSIPSYLKAVSGIFEQCMQFLRTLQPPQGPEEEVDPNYKEVTIKEMALKIFEPHLDLYLEEELRFFTEHAEREVGSFEQKLSEQDATVESFYMGNFNRQEDKKDFLNSFKKVVMMPVTVLPNLPGQLLGSNPFKSGKPQPSPTANGSTLQPTSPLPSGSRPHTPGIGAALDRKGSPMPGDKEAPNDELAAKAALMASRLEGIKTLFSIEMALNLVHAAKASLGRAAVFIGLGGQLGGEAREQCEAIFVVLLRVLGQHHVRQGFDRAVAHLAHYNPRATADHSEHGGVAPLVMFIELVNVGDLISQMVDVFYEQQLAGPKIADRNDFLDPAGLAKKKFEQMLDESVAAGLNKGIDVLMDEVEYICATTQLPADYNPPADGPASDMGPTQTATRVVELVRGHTSMLTGSTEKTMLDVFNGEVGLRLFGAVCKHLKRQRVSTEGAVQLIADTNLYYEYVRGLRNADLLDYFKALRELSQIYLIDARHAKEMAVIIADGDRFGGIFRAEEVYEFAERRADWYQVKRNVERAMYGLECCVM